MTEASAAGARGLPEPWSATLIVADVDGETPPPERPSRFRRAFTLDRDVASAELFVTACGVFECEINGYTASDHVLSPGWTSYRHRHRLIPLDVSALVSRGENAIDITVAEGWYRGRLGFGEGKRANYGEDIGPIAQLVVRYADGSTSIIATDATWRAQASAILSASLYDGETVDLLAMDAAWSRASYDDGSWAPVREAPFDESVLFIPESPPVRRIEELAPVSVERRANGKTIIDFGQNIAGRVRVRVPAAAGKTITMRHAEVLEHGELALRPLRGAKATDVVVCGDTPATWEPSFTFHGFRYAEIEGWPGTISNDDVRAIVCHTDMREIGTFSCSNEMLNRLHANARWSMKGNFLDVPTDCPQRNERLGWTGDLQVFAPTACFLYDCRSMLESWLDDLAAEQEQYGSVPSWVPFIEMGFPPIPTAAWGDAAVIVPWTLYRHFGDAEILRRHYASMRRWVEQVEGLAGESHLWDRGFQFGDWLDPAAPPDQPARARTDAGLVATAYHARTAGILAEAAAILGLEEDRQRFEALASAVRGAFTREYVTPGGRMASDAQTAFALGLQFGLLPTEVQREAAGKRLQQLVRREGYHVGTGFVGTPLLCDALADAGYGDDAYHLLLQTECPSWLYPITMGATTIWERWDSMLPDGSVNPGEMTSFNHYAFGAVADFLHRRVAGLAPMDAGYRTIGVRPLPGGGLTYAEAAREMEGGRAHVRWERDGTRFRIEVDVPDGHEAVVELPDGRAPTRIAAGSHRLECEYRAATDDPPRPAAPTR